MLKRIFLILLLALSQGFALADEIIMSENDGIYVFKVPLKIYAEKIKPYVNDELMTVSDLYKTGKFELVVNGGYFDIQTGGAISYVKINGEKKNSLFQNIPLLKRLEESDRAEQVLNRSELRMLKDASGDIYFDIQKHFDKPGSGKKIIHSIQAGPSILPQLKNEEESFIKYDKTGKIIPLAADVLKKRERTVVGLKYNPLIGDYSYLYIIIFTKDHKVSLTEARDYCENLGLHKAINFDGGASTSINYKDTEIYSAADGQRRVKSFLVIEK